MTLPIQLTKFDIEDAKAYNKRVHEAEALKNPNYTGLAVEGRYITGFLGELAFGRLLDQQGVVNLQQKNSIGRSDILDFRVFHQDKPLAIDVKCRNNRACYSALINESQWQRHSVDLYVFGAVGIREQMVDFWGYATRKDTMNWEITEIRTPCRKCAKQALKPLEAMFGKLDKVKGAQA